MITLAKQKYITKNINILVSWVHGRGEGVPFRKNTEEQERTRASAINLRPTPITTTIHLNTKSINVHRQLVSTSTMSNGATSEDHGVQQPSNTTPSVLVGVHPQQACLHRGHVFLCAALVNITGVKQCTCTCVHVVLGTTW